MGLFLNWSHKSEKIHLMTNLSNYKPLYSYISPCFENKQNLGRNMRILFKMYVVYSTVLNPLCRTYEFITSIFPISFP